MFKQHRDGIGPRDSMVTGLAISANSETGHPAELDITLTRQKTASTGATAEQGAVAGLHEAEKNTMAHLGSQSS